MTKKKDVGGSILDTHGNCSCSTHVHPIGRVSWCHFWPSLSYWS